MAVRKQIDGRGRVRWRVYVYDSSIGKSVYFGTFDRERDARDAEVEGRRRLRLGESLKPKKTQEQISFNDLAERWLDSLVSIRRSTRRDYDKAIRRMRPVIGRRLVSELDRRDVDKLIAVLSESYAPSTTHKTIVVCKMILRMAVDHGYIDRLPLGMSRLSMPRASKRVFEPLSADQVKKLVDAAPEYWRPFVQLLITSGLRGSEARGLRVEDLDLGKGIVRVRAQLIGTRLVELKTDAAYRDVPLPKQTLEMLKAHLETVPDSDLGLLFPTETGKPITASNFYARVWIPTRNKAGLPNFRIHDCRHHVASVYLAQGRSITYVQRLVGHSNPSTLLSIYSWVTKTESDVATTDFERWLGEESPSRYEAA